MGDPDYAKNTRAIFERIFLRTHDIGEHLSQEDLIALLKARQQSIAAHDQVFESLLLDAVRICDEQARDGHDASALEAINSVLSYFDRYDRVESIISKLAFMDNAALSEDRIKSLSVDKDVLDQLNPHLFRELFIDPLQANRNLTRNGLDKVDALLQGLHAVKTGDTTCRELSATITRINEVGR